MLEGIGRDAGLAHWVANNIGEKLRSWNEELLSHQFREQAVALA